MPDTFTFSADNVHCSKCEIGEQFRITYAKVADEVVPFYAKCINCGHDTKSIGGTIRRLENAAVLALSGGGVQSAHSKAGCAVKRTMRELLYNFQ